MTYDPIRPNYSNLVAQSLLVNVWCHNLFILCMVVFAVSTVILPKMVSVFVVSMVRNSLQNLLVRQQVDLRLESIRRRLYSASPATCLLAREVGSGNLRTTFCFCSHNLLPRRTSRRIPQQSIILFSYLTLLPRVLCHSAVKISPPATIPERPFQDRSAISHLALPSVGADG